MLLLYNYDVKMISYIGGGFEENASTMPLIQPENFHWTKTQSEVNVYIDRAISSDINPDKINFGWLLESPIVLKELGIYDYVTANLRALKEKYLKVFTCDKYLLNLDPIFAHAYSDIMPWIKKENYGIYPKSRLCSIIASHQKQHPGHKLRHEMIEKYSNKIDHFGFGFQKTLTIADSVRGFQDYYFSFCIENCSHPGYWGCKLTNAIATGTVPIYWGDPYIGDIFNTEGFILLGENFNFDSLTPELYEQKLPCVYQNFEILRGLKLPEDYLYQDYFSFYV